MKRKKVYVHSKNKVQQLTKTYAKSRKTYTYRFHGKETAEGKSREYIEEFIISPGEDGVTEEDIKNLYSMEDSEVYINLKSRRPERTEEEKAEIEEWKEEYIRHFKAMYGHEPIKKEVDEAADDAFPKNWCLSYDQILCGDYDNPIGDKSKILAKVCNSFESEPGLIEAMDEIAAEWSESWQEIYERVLKNGETIVSIARERGVTEGAVRKTVNKIRAKLSENPALRKFVRFFD